MALDIVLVFLLLGALLVWAGWSLLGEYRRLFLSDPRLVMAVEVLLQILFHPAGTAVFLGAIAILAGLWFLVMGIFVAVTPLLPYIHAVFGPTT